MLQNLFKPKSQNNTIKKDITVILDNGHGIENNIL